MKYHPYSDVWPLLEGPKFDKLVADIKVHGLHYPITVYKEMILDGRNRYRACVEAGVKPRFEQSKAKNDHDALILSASLNEHRRHMSEDQLAFVGAQITSLHQGQNKRYSETVLSNEKTDQEKPIITREEAAKAVGVSIMKLDDAKAIKTHAPELEKAVVEKKLSLRAAADEARSRGKSKKVVKKTVAEIQAANRARAVAKPPRQLTREDVDPEFKGSHLQFAAEYGHVYLQTSQERSTSRFSDWAIGLRHLARTFDGQKLPKINDVVLDWLRKPKQADIDSIRDSLSKLENAIGTGRSLLDRPEESLMNIVEN